MPDTVGWSGGKLAGIPLTKPPYAFLVALDLNAGDMVWKVPFGEGSQAIRQHPLLKGVVLPDRLGTPGQSGPIVTKGCLVFIGGGDPYLYAFDNAEPQYLGRSARAWRDERPIGSVPRKARPANTNSSEHYASGVRQYPSPYIV